MGAVSSDVRERRRRGSRPSGRNPEDEPEILEGLARDIVSRLSTTLFGESEVPVWERTGDRSPDPAAHPRRTVDPEPEEPPGLGGAAGLGGTGGLGGVGGVTASAGARSILTGLEATLDAAGGGPGPARPVASGGDRPALLVRGTVRSGRQVRHNGDIVVLGDVNPGAQLVAARDILVIGTLRGMAHAGATGDHGAVVAAFRLSPTQLRIASYLARPPEEPGEHPEYPEMALVRDGVVVVRPLTTANMSRLGMGDAEPDPA